MTVFKFKLEFLLRYRRQLEETAMYNLAQKVRKAGELEGELEAVTARGLELQSQVREQCAAPVPAPMYQMYKDYQDSLRRRGIFARRRLDKAEQELEKARKELVAASIDRKVIEGYKDRQKEAAAKARAREEQMLLDELASLSASRSRHDD